MLIGRCGGSGGAQFARATMFNNLTVPTSAQTRVAFDNFETTDTSAFYTATAASGPPSNLTGDSFLQMNGVGVYVGMIVAQFSGTPFAGDIYMNFEPGIGDFSTIEGASNWRSATPLPFPAIGDGILAGGFVMYVSAAAAAINGGTVGPYFLQNSGSDKTLGYCALSVQYTPAPGTITTVY